MNILVCIKQVPDVSKVEIDRETNNLKREGVPSIINPCDLNALTAALKVKKQSKGKITVISMGPPQASEAIREAIAMGADEGYVICDGAFRGSDTLATSYVLSQGAKKLGPFDLVFAGTTTLDGDTGQVGPEIAEILGFAQATYVGDLEFISDDKIKVVRNLENKIETGELKVPALISILRDSNEVKKATKEEIEALKDLEIKTLTAKDLEAEEDRIGQKGSATVVAEVYPPKEIKKGQSIEGSVDEQVDGIIKVLKDYGFVK